MGGLIFLVVIIVIVLWVLASCVRIVPQAYAMVVERLGAYKETWNTGIHFKTRFTLIPHGSVATSREARILVLIVSRDVSVSSSSMSPMIFRSVVAERFSIAMIGFSTPYA